MHFSSVFHKFSKYNNINSDLEYLCILVLALYIDGHPLSGGFRYRIYVIFHLKEGVISYFSHPKTEVPTPKSREHSLVNPHLPPNRERVHVHIL